MLNSPLLVAIGRGLVAGVVPAALIEAAVAFGGGSVNVVVVAMALALGAAVAVVRPAVGLEHDRMVARAFGLGGYCVVVAALQLIPSGVALIVALTILAAAFVGARLMAQRAASQKGAAPTRSARG